MTLKRAILVRKVCNAWLGKNSGEKLPSVFFFFGGHLKEDKDFSSDEICTSIFFLLLLLIHEADPQTRPVVIIIFALVSVRLSVRTSPFFKILQNKQTSSEYNDHYWWQCESGRGDHWWHMSCSSFAWKKVDFYFSRTSFSLPQVGWYWG